MVPINLLFLSLKALSMSKLSPPFGFGFPETGT